MAQDQDHSLGEFLRHEREKRGITLEQVASATKIGIRQLQSLETDNFAELPAKPFVRGFVISYCRFIGLDAKEVLARFSEFMEKKSQNRPARDASQSDFAFEKREGEQSRTILWFVLGGFMAVGAMVYIFLKPSLHRHRPSGLEKIRASHAVKSPQPTASGSVTPEVKTESSPEPAKPAVVVAPSAAPVATPLPVAVSTPSPNPKDILNSGADLPVQEIKHKVVFKALANVLVRYRVDDRPMMRFPFKKDRLLVLRARNAIRIQVSNANSIAILYGSPTYRPLVEVKDVVVRQNNPTLFIPAELAKTIEEPFPGERPLPLTSPPTEGGASPSPAPSP